MEALKRRPESVLLVLLVAGIVSTALHYTDNAVNIEQYPEPGWITPGFVAASWVVLTAVGVAGYRLYKQGRVRPACVCLAIYSYTGISSLAHFGYSLSGYSFREALFITTDGLTGFAILAFAAWAAWHSADEARAA